MAGAKQVSSDADNQDGTAAELAAGTALDTADGGAGGPDGGVPLEKRDFDNERNPEEATGSSETGQEPVGGECEADSTEPHKPSSPPKPDLMDRYAAKPGLRWHAGEKCYCHQDGRWIERAENPFHWVEMSASGEPTRRLWVQDQTLTRGIELPAELWSLIRSEPRSSVLLFKDGADAPVSLTGGELIELQAAKQIPLYPSRYRIAENNP
jgi:hypothetical protein